jgi:hypothetical protein
VYFLAKIIRRTVNTHVNGKMARKIIENFQADKKANTQQPIPRPVRVAKSANLELKPNFTMFMLLLLFILIKQTNFFKKKRK